MGCTRYATITHIDANPTSTGFVNFIIKPPCLYLPDLQRAHIRPDSVQKDTKKGSQTMCLIEPLSSPDICHCYYNYSISI